MTSSRGWSRRRWLASLFGPGVISMCVGAAITLVGLAAWMGSTIALGLVMVALGLGLVTQARASLHMYRLGYFTGRADQLVDIELGQYAERWDPWPWDPRRDWPTS